MNELTEQIVSSRAEIYPIVLIAFWSITLLFNLIITAVLKGDKKKWGDFWGIWSLTALVSGIILIFVVMSPEQLLNFINWIKDLFK